MGEAPVWFMRNLRVNDEQDKGYFFMINEPDDFDIDEVKWADNKVNFNIVKIDENSRGVEFEVPSNSISLSMALASLREELEYILTEHMKPTLEVYGPQPVENNKQTTS